MSKLTHILLDKQRQKAYLLQKGKCISHGKSDSEMQIIYHLKWCIS